MARRHISLTDRDHQVLEVLTKRVRTLSNEQVARIWWPQAEDSAASAHRSLRRLIAAGFLLSGRGMAHPLLPLTEPVATWKPGSPEPDADAIAYRLASRWTSPSRVVTWYSASRAAAGLTGGYGGRSSRTSELTHDIHLAEVFLHMANTRPAAAQTWVSEPSLFANGLGRYDRLPDAIAWEHDRPRAIEFAGRYTASKLREFHDFCSCRDLPYELW